MAEDLEQGFLDRLKSLPIARFSVLAGRSLADTTMLAWSLVISTIIGFAVGFRIHGSVLSSLEAVLLCVLFGFAFEWLFILLGLVGKTPQAAQGLSLMVFPFTFISSAYVPVASMPSWLRGFAEHQPITVMVNAVRTLTQGTEMERLLGHPASHFVSRSLIWSVVLVVVFAPLAVAKFRKS
jgi:ABC-2 type transport system permease protein